MLRHKVYFVYLFVILTFLVARALPEDVSNRVIWTSPELSRQAVSLPEKRVSIEQLPNRSENNAIAPMLEKNEGFAETAVSATVSVNSEEDGVSFSLVSSPVVTPPPPDLLVDRRIQTVSLTDSNNSARAIAQVAYNVNARTGPGVAYEAFDSLTEGDEVILTGWGDGWFEVEKGGVRFGWVTEDALSIPLNTDLSNLPRPVVGQPDSVRQMSFDAVVTTDTAAYDGPDLEDFDVKTLYIPSKTLVRLVARNESGEWVLATDTVSELGWISIDAISLSQGFRVDNLPEFNVNPPHTIANEIFGNFAYGGQTHSLDNLPLMRDLDMSWVKIQYKWREGSRPEELSQRIQQAHSNGFKILVSITGEPYPKMINFNDYVQFLGQVAALPTPPDAIEVWNEMNIDFEWPAGYIHPLHYLDFMLAPAYTAIKEANPSIVVISGAPAPTGFQNGTNAWADARYISVLAQAGAADFIDCVGVHYNAGATSPRALNGHPAGGFYGWYFEPSLSMYYRAFEGKRPLCITEIGYLRGDTNKGKLPETFWWAENTTEADQGKWLAEAKRYAMELGYVRFMVVFNVDIQHWDKNDPQSGYSLIQYPEINCPACKYMTGSTSSQE